MTRREPLVNAGGPVASEGEGELAGVLARALKRAVPDERDLLTHGFHSYAARMHPLLARSVIESLVTKDQRLLDPFCGSGTVLVEAVRAGVQSYGSDINPLALRLSRTKCELRDETSRERFAALLRDIAHLSTERVQERRPIQAKLSKQEAQWYAPHVIKELAGIYAEIQKLADAKDKDALEILFSAIVVKFSKQQSDTSERKVEKRIRKGLCTEFFQRKGLELIRRWEELHTESPSHACEPKIVRSDARDVHKKLNRHFDLLLTSPPYGGTYNYVDHHKRRFAWLGLRADEMAKNEIGSRRQEGSKEASWDRDLLHVLSAAATVLKDDGKLVLVMGDAQLGKKRFDANRQVQRLAKRAGLRWIASASQSRPDWTGGRNRKEHLIALRLATP